jgi:hypothetical protein
LTPLLVLRRAPARQMVPPVEAKAMAARPVPVSFAGASALPLRRPPRVALPQPKPRAF